MLAELLAHHGFVARWFTDGRKALESGLVSRADVVMTDLKMPGSMSGEEIAREARSDPRTFAALLAISGNVDVEDASATLFDAFLAKPTDLVLLPALVRSLARQARARRAASTAVEAPRRRRSSHRPSAAR